MKRIPLQYFVLIGLFFWGLPASIVAGPQAILYTVAAGLPVWWFGKRAYRQDSYEQTRFGTTTCVLLVGGAVSYLTLDALVGQELFRENLFLFGPTAVTRVVDVNNQSIGEGRGLAGLIGAMTVLLPFCLIDVAERGPRWGRWALWGTAFLLLFYQVTTSRALVLFAVLSIILVRTYNWRRLVIAGGIAFAAFTLASSLRGDYGNTSDPLINGISAPYVNLLLMLSSHCGTAPWYQFILEFLKKFVPAFIFPKKIFSFNMEMSLCIYPTADNTVSAVSIFTWMGEILYYKPSILTSLAAGVMLGGMAWIVDRQMVRHQLFSARMYAGFLYIIALRSRVLDAMSYLIAQWAFVLVWPYLANLARSLHILAIPVSGGDDAGGPRRETL